MSFNKVTAEMLAAHPGVSGMPIVPGKQGYSTEDAMKAFDDQMENMMVPAFNALVDAIIAEIYTKTQTDAAIAAAVFAAGAADMCKAIYDTGNKAQDIFAYADTKAAAAQAAAQAAAMNLWTHAKTGTVHALTGTGTKLMFTATADFAADDTFTCNGTAATAKDSAGTALAAGAFKSGDLVTGTLAEGVLTVCSYESRAQVNQDLDWKLVQEVTGTTDVSIPSNAKEIMVCAHTSISNEKFVSTATITTKMLRTEDICIYLSGGYAPQDSRNVKVTANASRVKLYSFIQDGTNYSSTVTVDVYYR